MDMEKQTKVMDVNVKSFISSLVIMAALSARWMPAACCAIC